MLITEIFCYCTRCFLQTDIWQAMCSCSSRIACRPIVHISVKYLCQATPEFVSPDLWPPNSPNCNLADYKIWGCVQEHVYEKPICDVNQLKQRLVEMWSDVQQTIVDAAIGEWRTRLRACIRANRHILNIFNLFMLSVVCLAYSFKHHSVNV